MMRNKLVGLGVVVMLALALVVGAFGCASAPAPSAPAPAPSAPAPAPEVIHWKGQNAYGMGPVGHTGWFPQGWGKWVEEATDGRLIIDVADPGAIVPVMEMSDAVSKGVLDFAGLYYAGFYGAKMPEANVEVGLPFAWQNMTQYYQGMFQYGIADIIQPLYAENNIYWIPVPCNMIYGYGFNFDFKSLDDLKGKRIRVGAGVYGRLMEELGAVPTVLPHSELYMALKLGTIDGCQASIESCETWHAEEVWKSYMVSPNPNQITGNYLINLDSWNALPDDIREIIERDAQAANMLVAAKSRAAWETFVGDSVREYGLKLVTLSEEDTKRYRDIAVGLWDEVAEKSPRCAQLVDIVKTQLRETGR